MIDGGLPQLSSALAAVQKLELRIPIIALAKKQEEVYLPGQTLPVLLDRKSKALKLLINIRDEAHRFAITYHKLLRSKEAFS